MTTKATELRSNPNGDRRQCPTCNQRPDRVRMDRLWAWSLAHPGERPVK